MKKIILPIVLFCLLSVIFIPFLVQAGLVPCTGAVTCTDVKGTKVCKSDCTICSVFKLIINIYDFISKDIATPLAIIAITIGGIMMMISAGNPNLMGQGKKILFTAIIGLVLVFCSYLIIGFVLSAVGYTDSWTSLNLNC